MPRLRPPSTFFFQAEDGIRDLYVTGVQTCALPILPALAGAASGRCRARAPFGASSGALGGAASPCRLIVSPRSEERRVGKECRPRWLPLPLKKKHLQVLRPKAKLTRLAHPKTPTPR